MPTKSYTPQKKQIIIFIKPFIIAEAKAIKLIISKKRRIQRPKRFIN